MPHPDPVSAPHGGTAVLSAGVNHYENFPVASLLCPPALRPAVVAIYHFARTADDLADEGDAGPEERLGDLAAYRSALDNSLQDIPTSLGFGRWPGVFQALHEAHQRHRLPGALLHDLLSAFEQDIRHTASGHRYPDHNALIAYCRLSAHPVGRLLLHLYGVNDETALRQSDDICSALQLINFWQDISVDLARSRVYLPTAELAAEGLVWNDFLPGASDQKDAARQAVVAGLCQQARALMISGAPLVHSLPGRAGWELRLVVQGGLRILDRIAAIQHQSWKTRPTIGRRDLAPLVWKALRM